MKKTKTGTKIILAALFVGLSLAAGIFVLAKDEPADQKSGKPDDKTQTVIDDKKKKIDEVEAEIRRYTGDMARLDQEATTLDLKIKISSDEIEVTNLGIEKTGAEIEQTDSQIQITKQQVEEKEKDLQYQRNILSSLIRDLRHFDDNRSSLTMLLRSSTFSDFLKFQEQTLSYQADVKNMYDKVKALKDDLLAKKYELEDHQKEQMALKAQLDEQHNELERQRKDNESLLTKTQKREDKYQELIGESAEKQKKLAAEIQTLEQELMTSRGGSTPAGPPSIGAGLLREPMKGALGSISQSYGLTGYAKSGVYGYNGDGSPRIHAGVDFAEPCGTTVVAVADGQVFGTGSLTYGFGNWIVLFHPKLNLYSLYGHLSRGAVAPGQIVKQGDIIGFEGTTGFSTGCHLHLGIYTQMATVKTSYGESPWYAPEKTVSPMGLF